jgi:hypothetical protein
VAVRRSFCCCLSSASWSTRSTFSSARNRSASTIEKCRRSCALSSSAARVASDCCTASAVRLRSHANANGRTEQQTEQKDEERADGSRTEGLQRHGGARIRDMERADYISVLPHRPYERRRIARTAAGSVLTAPS